MGKRFGTGQSNLELFALGASPNRKRTPRKTRKLLARISHHEKPLNHLSPRFISPFMVHSPDSCPS
jgi:hypothetical protein